MRPLVVRKAPASGHDNFRFTSLLTVLLTAFCAVTKEFVIALVRGQKLTQIIRFRYLDILAVDRKSIDGEGC